MLQNLAKLQLKNKGNNKEPLTITSVEAPLLIELAIKVNSKTATYEEIKEAVEETFNCKCPIEYVMDYFHVQRIQEDLTLMFRHCGLNY